MTSKTPTMTRAHFELVAATLKAERERVAHVFRDCDDGTHATRTYYMAQTSGLRLASEALAESFARTNPRFDLERFLAACVPD